MQRRPVIPPNPFPLHREPGCEALRARLELHREPFRTHPTPVRDLVVVDEHPPGTVADEHRAQLMLRPGIVELSLILKLEQEVQRALQSKLFVQPAVDGRLHGLGTPRMAAATVRPVVRPQWLGCRATLQQQLAAVVENEQRESAMQDATSFVAASLAHVAHFSIRLVDEDERLGLGRTVAATPQCSLGAACTRHTGTPGLGPNVYHVRNSRT